ncbi:phosphonate ABC transporter, permease protein PhnE [Microbacterium sp. NIBRBAC000506063]|uniref:phosphonate ABC transporter, permease protein PhnE n=1 Tax=Microbacterium sp. NIBRBAC000506063 TaxID=2734618 RepID=UPI001BB618D7|nr:phosphonate ABC transporter, permease protein PhnE [Microbacterium sp. NIBRBAC000506063]QTV79579.1 phosphonate ABC transporter, permease protein PhnE [Microbacterium sp. NIBRBAC000506063]
MGQIVKGIDYAERFLQRTVPFVWPSFGEIVWYSTLTLAIVICGTVLAAVLSIPVASLAARNTTPGKSTRWVGRALTVVTRAAPDAILALIFALIIGQGALAGILALGIHSIGMISKLTADAIEQIDEGPRLALRAAGATRSQEFWGAIWPQILPAFVAIVLHRTDINLRVSVILGFVGVYGLGYELSHHLQTLNYREAMPYAIIIFVLCVAFEIIASAVRRTLLGVEPTGKGLGDRTVRAFTKGRSAKTEDAAASAPQRPSRVRPWDRARLANTVFAWFAAIAVVGSIVVASTQTSSFANVWQNAVIAWNRLWPPMMAREKWEPVFFALLETVQIALAATLFALAFSAIIGSFSARNVAPNTATRNAFRFLLVGIRGLPELLLALFFIILTGLGSGAAVLALGIGGIGLLGKLFADSLEEVDPGPERALRATGASRLQIFGSATLPQAAPAFIGHTLYMFDTNVRSATILGIVGGGGIGYMLSAAARVNQHELLFLLLCVLVIVLLIEALSSWIRQLIS